MTAERLGVDQEGSTASTESPRDATSRPLIVPFELAVCAYTGDPGCLGWPEGDHDEPCEDAIAVFHRCTECGEDDVYGEIHHADGCPGGAA